MDANKVILRAKELKKCIPAFNVPHLPMLKPLAEAIRDENSVGMLQVSRIEWEKMSAKSLEHIAEEYGKHHNAHTLLHLDHIPAIDEDIKRVDFLPLIERAIKAGYHSVMIDGSRLPLEENIAVTAEVAALVHPAGIACEAELGAVMGHESTALPPYEEIFAKKIGFTKADEAARFVAESKCDWLSVAAGNIHGAVAEAVRNQKKPEARLDVAHIEHLSQALQLPLVLHGGSGVNHQCLMDSIEAGIAKINVATEMRQTYEFALKESSDDILYAQEQLYIRARKYIHDFLGNTDLKDMI